jgi:hypothetical protein
MMARGSRSLLEGSAEHPPRYVRALYYNYRFSSSEDKAKGIWWNRELLGIYFPPVRPK